MLSPCCSSISYKVFSKFMTGKGKMLVVRGDKVIWRKGKKREMHNLGWECERNM